MTADPSIGSVLGNWTFEPSVLAGVVLTGIFYATGVQELDRRHKLGRLVKQRHIVSFALGLLAILLALVSPIDALSAQLFSVHMFQHVLLLSIAPPLLLLGKPVPVLLVGLPRPLVLWVARFHRRSASLRWLVRCVTSPAVTWIVFSGVMLIWHLPAFYQAALFYPGIHLAEHVCYLVAGLLFWWVALQPFPGRPRLAYGWRMLYTATAMLPGSGLGLLFLTVSTPVYSFYADLPRLWGIGALDDQSMAGLVMWLFGDTILLGAAGWFFVAMLERHEQSQLAKAALLEHTMGGSPTIGGTN